MSDTDLPNCRCGNKPHSFIGQYATAISCSANNCWFMVKGNSTEEAVDMWTKLMTPAPTDPPSLKQCPACEGKAVRYVVSEIYTAYRFQCHCSEIDCGFRTEAYESQAGADAAWNRQPAREKPVSTDRIHHLGTIRRLLWLSSEVSDTTRQASVILNEMEKEAKQEQRP